MPKLLDVEGIASHEHGGVVGGNGAMNQIVPRTQGSGEAGSDQAAVAMNADSGHPDMLGGIERVGDLPAEWYAQYEGINLDNLQKASPRER